MTSTAEGVIRVAESCFYIRELSEAVTDLSALLAMHAASYTSDNAYASIHVPRMMKQMSHETESSLSRLLDLKEGTRATSAYRECVARIQTCVSRLDNQVRIACPELRAGATKEAIDQSKACADRSARSVDILSKRQSAAFLPAELSVRETDHLLKRRGVKGKLTSVQLDYIVRESSRGVSAKRIAFSIGRSEALISRAIEDAFGKQ